MQTKIEHRASVNAHAIGFVNNTSSETSDKDVASIPSKTDTTSTDATAAVTTTITKKSAPQRVLPKPLPKIAPYGRNAIEITDLTFAYDVNPSKPILRDLQLKLETGSRCLLIGANGSGKSTLLRILAGRHLTHPDGSVRVLGLNSFRDTKLNFHRAYLDCDWGMRTIPFAGASVPLMADIPVRKMMERLQQSYPDRRDELVQLLGIDLNWRMHLLSDGQRRRVQILLGLIRPFKILLLDEVTTSLDVCVRQDLLRWLARETHRNDCTVLYATHIFDGLDDWPTHLFYLTDTGSCGWQGELDQLDYYQQLKEQNHPAKMLAVAEHWLRKEIETKRKAHQLEQEQGALAHHDSVDPTNRQGGYASGRNLNIVSTYSAITTNTTNDNSENGNDINYEDPPLKRRGRISDIMGNSGVMEKHA